MLKRFLKFFKPSDQEELPQFEGSYLDYLLSKASEEVEGALDTCPEHEPLLLVITQILNISMPGVWSSTLRQPLTDAKPPAPAPLAPPPPPGAPESTLDEPDTSPTDDEEIEAILEEAEALDANGLEESTALEALKDESIGEDKKVRLDRPEVLQAGRVFLGMLIENDRLPPEIQLDTEETLLARDLLMSYFMGQNNFEGRAQKLLKIVERKFSEGHFSQARILLQLFQTDAKTRIRNDRNIFYEDMIQRFGVRRKRPLNDELVGEFKALKAQSAEATKTLTWIEEQLHIKTHVFVRQAQHVEQWKTLASKSSSPHAQESLLRYLPPKRWRSIQTHEATVEELVHRHIANDTLGTYCMNLLNACYFVLRAVGDTGLESYLDHFFNWSEEQFDLDATIFLPELYRRSMGDADTMRVIFQDLYDRFIRARAEMKLQSFTKEEKAQALHTAIQKLQDLDPNEIAPGNYSLGALVFDELFGMVYASPEFSFKIHRLT